MDIDIGKINQDLNSAEASLNTAKSEISIAESKIKSIRTEVNSGGGGGDPEVTFGIAARIRKILSNAGANIFTCYSCWEYLTYGRIRMWYLWQRINLDNSKTNFFLSCTSNDGYTWNTSDVENQNGNPSQGYGCTSGMKFKGFYYHVYNRAAVDQLVEKRFFKSTTGHTWTEYQTSKIWKLGEDHNLFLIKKETPDEEMIMFVRPQLPGHPLSNGKRHISIMRSKDGFIWTDPIQIFTSTDYNEQYYSMSVCEVRDNLYYGCLNVYNKSKEQVTMRIMKSNDLLTWIFKENIPLPVGVNQQFGAVSYNAQKQEIDILTLENENDHAGRGNPLNRFYIALYKTKVNGI